MTRQAGKNPTAFWLLCLLALMIRLGQPSLSSPDLIDTSPSLLDAFSAFCQSTSDPTHLPKHKPATVQEQDGLMSAEMQAAPLLTAALSQPGCSLVLLGATAFWRFPPVRGPPERQLSALYAQGPPLRT